MANGNVPSLPNNMRMYSSLSDKKKTANCYGLTHKQGAVLEFSQSILRKWNNIL